MEPHDLCWSLLHEYAPNGSVNKRTRVNSVWCHLDMNCSDLYNCVLLCYNGVYRLYVI